MTPKELDAAKESLIVLYELKDEYAKAKAYLTNIEKQMAQRYDTVNRVLMRIKERPAATITAGQFAKKGEGDGR